VCKRVFSYSEFRLKKIELLVNLGKKSKNVNNKLTN
jgi:hypothetical protein